MKKSIFRYKQFDFFISRIRFFISRIQCFHIHNSIFYLKKKSIFHYRQFDFFYITIFFISRIYMYLMRETCGRKIESSNSAVHLQKRMNTDPDTVGGYIALVDRSSTYGSLAAHGLGDGYMYVQSPCRWNIAGMILNLICSRVKWHLSHSGTKNQFSEIAWHIIDCSLCNQIGNSFNV